jgi:hypothetical protein
MPKSQPGNLDTCKRGDKKEIVVVYRSFSRTLIDTITGVIKLDDLRKPETKFLFGCMRVHVFQHDGRLPYEATWANSTLKMIHHRHSVGIEEVDPDKQDVLREFFQIIEQADTDGKVEFRQA